MNEAICEATYQISNIQTGHQRILLTPNPKQDYFETIFNIFTSYVKNRYIEKWLYCHKKLLKTYCNCICNFN